MRKAAKNVRKVRTKPGKGSKLRAEIEELEHRLAKAKAEFGATEEFDLRDAAKLLERLVQRVESEGERLYLKRGDKRIAALVPADEAEYLEQLEERRWNEVADKAIEEPGTISLEQVKKELGL